MSIRTCVALIFICILILVASSAAQAPVPGQNVNMVSGTKWPGGDPFLQRQNEPSMAVSTRNPQHLLAGANDYRTVDLNLVDQLPINQLNGDAWLGVFKSFDGGQRWASTLLPGFPQDQSNFGASSPMKGFAAASDPVVRAGTNGMFYYSSIALNRGTNIGGLFLSRFIDLNNKENGDAAQSNYPAPTTDPIRYLNTVKIDSGNAGQFIDKPWIAVDIPRAGAGTCAMQVPVDHGATVTQSFPAGNVYIAYAKFVGGTINIRSKINFAKSSDCGATWTKPIMISQTYAINQGTQVAVDPETGYVYVAWRVFSAGNDSDEIVVAKSTDAGNTFSKAVPVRMLPPFNLTTPTASAFFDEGTTNTAFRTQSMPAIAVDDSGSPGLPGNVYVAWSERGVGPNGDGRILLSVSPNGITWPAPTPVDNGPLSDDAANQFTRGHQLMPAMTFIEGKLMILYYDLRLDHTVGLFDVANPFPDVQGRFFPESRMNLGDSPAAVFTPFVDDGGLTQRRHTIDVVVSQSAGGLNPTFTNARVSRYDFGLPALNGDGDEFEQLKVNPPNLPMFAQGTVPFIGDYIDIAGQMFTPVPGGGWTFNNPAPAGTAAASKPVVGSAVHYSTWTTNQDVVPPPDGNWAKYTPITNGTSIYNGTATQPCATDAQGFGWEGDRNQNIYDSRITQGLLVTSPQNSKPLLDENGHPIQRAFAVLVQNATNLTKYFQLTIANQPPGNFNINNNGTITVGGYASFQQAVPNQPALPNPLPMPVTVSNVAMAPHSGAVRSVFVLSNVINASVSVNVNETDANGNLISGGLSSFLVLNSDPSVVAQLALPDGSTTDPNLAEIYDPNIVTPNIITPNITTPNITTPNIITPNIITPNIVTPNITTPNIVTPNITTPNIVTTGVTNPNIVTPNITTPNITTSSLTDAVYTVSNTGNTNAGYHVKLTGNTSTQLQLAVAQVYTTPTSYQCSLIPQVQNVTLTNVTSPEFTPVNQLGTPNIVTADPNDATIYLGPGDKAEIVLRGQVDVPTMQQIVTTVAPVVIPEAINTNSTATTPTFVAPLFIATAALPDGVASPSPQPLALTAAPASCSGTYCATLQAIGGVLTNPANPACTAYAWTPNPVGLPPGLSLSAGGVITGTPTASNPSGYTFTVQVTDCAGQSITKSLSIRVADPLVLSANPQPAATGVVGLAFTPVFFSATGGIAPLTWAQTGTLPPGLNFNAATQVLSGTPTVSGTYNFGISVHDSAQPQQSVSQAYTVTITEPVLIFAGTATDPTGDTNPATVNIGTETAPNLIPSPDLTLAHVNVFNNRTVLIDVHFAPETFNPANTDIDIELDTDSNPATGSPGSDSGCVTDAADFGNDYFVQIIAPAAQAQVFRATGGCNNYVQVGSAPVTVLADGYSVSLPWDLIGDPGLMNFKVISFTNLSTGGNTGVLDYMPNPGFVASTASTQPARTVHITAIDTYILENGTTQVTEDLSKSTFTALVPNGQGGYTALTGTGTPNGTYDIPNVPVGYYYLRFSAAGHDLLRTDASNIDFSSVLPGRPNAVPATSGTLNFSLDNMSPWQSTDDAEIYAPNAGVGLTNFEAANFSFTSLPVVGATSFGGGLDWTQLSLITSTQGDNLYVLKLGSIQQGGHTWSYLQNLYKNNTLVQTDNSATSVTGSFTSPAQNETFHAAANGAAFIQNMVGPGNGPTLGSTSMGVYVTPPGPYDGVIEFDPFVVGLDAQNHEQITASIDAGDIAYADPFPADWQRLFTYAQGGFQSYTAPGATSPTGLFLSSIVVTRAMPSASAPASPIIGPVLGITINGLAQPQGPTGTTPYVAWQAASAFANYRVRIWSLTATEGGASLLSPSPVVFIETTKTSVQVPPGFLNTGTTYVVQVDALGMPADWATAPKRFALPLGVAKSASNAFTP